LRGAAGPSASDHRMRRPTPRSGTQWSTLEGNPPPHPKSSLSLLGRRLRNSAGGPPRAALSRYPRGRTLNSRGILERACSREDEDRTIIASDFPARKLDGTRDRVLLDLVNVVPSLPSRSDTRDARGEACQTRPNVCNKPGVTSRVFLPTEDSLRCRRELVARRYLRDLLGAASWKRVVSLEN